MILTKIPINQISVLQLKVGVKNILEQRWQHNINNSVF